MRRLKEYNISFAGLKQGKHEFSYNIDKKFLDLFEYSEFNDLQQMVTIILDKKSTFLELHFVSKGTVNVNCDLTNEPFDLPTENQWHLIVKFAEQYNDDNDELLVLPHGEHQINVAQYIYDLVVLSVPAKRVHPQVATDGFQSEILEKLKALSPRVGEVSERKLSKEDIDPRWNELKKLINNGKDK